MATITPTLNPVGNITVVAGIEDLVAKMKAAWQSLVSQYRSQIRTVGVKFFIQALDDLIVYLVQHDIPGADKKATVLNYIGQVYDWIATQIEPFWLRPFNGVIKDFVINIVVSHAIDWIVSKYQSGAWAPQATTTLLAKYQSN